MVLSLQKGLRRQSGSLDSPKPYRHVERMKASEADILFIAGSGELSKGHWQSRWQRKLASAREILPPRGPDCTPEGWTQVLVDAVGASTRPVVLVAHSLGIAAAIHALPKIRHRVAGAFFVSPADLSDQEALLRKQGLSELGALAPYPTVPLSFPSIMIASRNDPHGSFEHAGDIANAWGSFLIDAGQSGHIDVESGHGPWPEGTMVFAQFISRLKPVPLTH